MRYFKNSILLVLSRRNSNQVLGIRTFGFTFRRTPWPRSSHVCPLTDTAHPVCVSFPFDSSIQVEEVYIRFNERVSSASGGVYNVSDIERKCLMLSALDMTAHFRVVFVILALLRIMYLPGFVCQNRPVEGQLDLRMWIIHEDNAALFPFKMLLLKLSMSLINSNE